MKVPYQRRVEIKMSRKALENFIKELLSCDDESVQYSTLSQELIINKEIKFINLVRKNIAEWLEKGITSQSSG